MSDIPSFTPWHPLQDRFLKFTGFLFSNISELSKPQPPLPPLSPVVFACTDRRIKGRFPHRTAEISAFLSPKFDDPRPSASNLEDVFDEVKANDVANVGNGSANMDSRKDSPLNEMHRGEAWVQMEHGNVPLEMDYLFEEDNACLNIDTCKDSTLIEMPCGQMDVDHHNGNNSGELSCIKMKDEASFGTHESDEMHEAPCFLPYDNLASPCTKTNDSIEGDGLGECEHIEQNRVEKDNDLEEGELSEKWIESECTDSVQEENEAETRVAPEHSKEKFEFVKGDGTDTPGGFFLSHYFSGNFANDSYVQELNDEPLLADISTGKKKKKKLKKKKTTCKQKQVAMTRADAVKVCEFMGLLKNRQTKGVSAGPDLHDKNKTSSKKQEKGDISVNSLGKSRVVSEDGITRAEGTKEQDPMELQHEKQRHKPQTVKGILSKAVEEEVGLWTSDVGDDHHLMVESEANNVKPKRTLTAARKKKRQIAKHRKAAQKEAALGIRRLRLKPPIIKKERQIKFCQFYLKGKCTKGTECTFSHNIIPLTKSEICKYFINNCCLKGEDCPFSHALSTFPCKFFHTRGYCLDAESCRFSHEPITEEKRQELQRKVEKEQQVRQGNLQPTTEEKKQELQRKVEEQQVCQGILTATDTKLSYMDVNLNHAKGVTISFDPPSTSFVPEFPPSCTMGHEEFCDYGDAIKNSNYTETHVLNTDCDVRCGKDSTISDDAKMRAMKILQASLEANQHVSKRKPASMVDSVPQAIFGMPITKKTSSPLTAMLTNEKSGECSESKTFDSQSHLSSSILLDKFLKPQVALETKAVEGNKRATVDSLLSKILNG